MVQVDGIVYFWVIVFRGAPDLATYTVNGKHYESLFRDQVISTFQQRACLDKIIFMQDSSPHITKSVVELL